MDHFRTIEQYCKGIGISKPKHSEFDIRRFEINMKTVNLKQPPFRHEFYAIAIKVAGGGKAISGHHTDFPTGYTIFFNSPYQILSWDILPDWEGFYIIFNQDFISRSSVFNNILNRFPFLKIEKDIPLEIGQKQVDEVLAIYESIYEEYHSNHKDKFQIIESQVLLLLNYIKRYFKNTNTTLDVPEEIRKTDLKILGRFQTLIETSFFQDIDTNFDSKLHSTSFYADILNVHPNHLNTVTKQITGQTAKQLIQNHVINLAKSRLINTQLSVKEIAYSLHYESPNNFSSFFKKMTGKTPNSYRKESNI
ncbi:helix-turn-helix domain-containing protein [Gaetbulibacter jejuensis]|jgi:AraC-like DNA-binding protein|uniref:helix-turn-helix domain-containing protein n=1 Tax=Gaetbulibacter jejuensis TaxID=584607 RepID=UPI003008AB9D